MHGLKNMSYTNRLNICNIESLEIRHLHADLITLYKIIHDFIDCNNISFNFSSISNQGNRTRDNSYKLFLYCLYSVFFMYNKGFLLLLTC